MPSQLESLQKEWAAGEAAPGQAPDSQSLQLRTAIPLTDPGQEQGALGLVGILGGQCCQPAPDPAAMEKLLALCPPGTGSNFVAYVLQGKCLGELEVREGPIGLAA